MPSISVADYAGACYGVQRALDLVNKVAAGAQGPVHTLGPLIHNPQVVAELEASGVTVAQDVPTEAGSTLILRTHGVVPEIEELAHERGLEVVDATCPYVKRVHHAVERLQKQGYQVLVVGEQGHPEVEAILGHAPGAVAITTPEEARALHLGKKVGVVVQTTQSKVTLDAVVNTLTSAASEVCVINTICEATSERQGAAASLSKTCDTMVVIGGRNSANTKRLAEICREACAQTYLVETADELDSSMFSSSEHIGITAGASTPKSQIDVVIERIKSFIELHD